MVDDGLALGTNGDPEDPVENKAEKGTERGGREDGMK